MLEFFDVLGENSLQGFPRECVPRVFGELFSAELEVMVIVKLPELDIDHVEVLIAEEVRIAVDVGFGIDVHQTLEDLRVLELSRWEN